MDEVELPPLEDTSVPADAAVVPSAPTGVADPAAAGMVELPADLSRLTDVTVELTVEVGRTRMSLGEALALGPGSVVTLDRLADRPVDLLVNGRPIARGEVVVIDEQFGLRITEIAGLSGEQQAPAAAEQPAA
ncbi:flagellar motor switch protein FliN [Conexibacter sp. SYSU D00693]|uniref:flagellar motor switch protein FliN n=1 Tax=Conexibacter sp. SYSU D00693 TaxID=2812560 RepID=UPI00196B4BD3|nr:flagellar motor switch protein FliN [Conexibacter sp. SYSU D00693]